jgi:hypothetical protein
LPRGGTVEVNVPIKSAAGANTITGVVQLADGDLNPILEPTVLTIVNSAAQVSNNDADAVSISYASPTITSQSAVNSSTTKVYFSGFVWNHSITTGGAYAEVAFPSAPSSTSTPTTNCSNPYLTSSYSFPYTVGPAALQSPETAITSNINVYAGTPYCFRIYATVGSTTYYGNWEFFQSIGSPPAGGPYGTHSAPSVGTTNCSTSGGGCATSSCSAGGTCGGCSTSCAGGFGNSLAPPPPAVVSPPPPPPPALSPIAPTLTGAAQARDRWRMGSALAVISKAKHHKAKGPPVGDTFTFTLNETASVSLTFLRESTGRSVGGRCATETKANKHKHKCTISTPVGTLSFTGHAGTNTVVFDGRVSATQTLTPGGYSVGLAATNTAAQASATSSLSFTIAK